MNIEYEKLTPYPDQDNKLTFLTGTKTLEPIKYHIKCETVRYYWFFTKQEYFIESEFIILKGYNSLDECMEVLIDMQVSFKDIVIHVPTA